MNRAKKYLLAVTAVALCVGPGVGAAHAAPGAPATKDVAISLLENGRKIAVPRTAVSETAAGPLSSGDHIQNYASWFIVPDANGQCPIHIEYDFPDGSHVYGSWGQAECYTDFQVAWWDTGETEVSLLGTNGAVFDQWTQSNDTVSGWASLGGHDLVGGVWWTQHPVLESDGGDGKLYCRAYNGGWGGWYTCGDSAHQVYDDPQFTYYAP